MATAGSTTRCGALPLVDHTDVVAQLRDALRPGSLLLSLAHAGDAATTILGANKRKTFEAALRNPNHGTFDAILFSAGGNDIVGEQFRFWLRSAASVGSNPAQAINQDAFDGVMAVVKAGYLDLVDLRTRTLGPNAPIFIHAYDFAVPDGRGVCTVGPWLWPSLNDRGWMNDKDSPGDRAIGAAIVKKMLSQLDTMMQALEANPVNNIVYVRTQGLLRTGNDYTDDWTNELHPTPAGFEQVAAAFVTALEGRFPGRAAPP